MGMADGRDNLALAKTLSSSSLPAATRVASFLAFVASRTSSLMIAGACWAARALISAVALLGVPLVAPS